MATPGLSGVPTILKPSPPAVYVRLLAALPSELTAAPPLPAIEPLPVGDGPIEPARLPDGTPISPVLVYEALNRLFSEWGRPGVPDDNPWLPTLPEWDTSLPLLQLFAQVIRS